MSVAFRQFGFLGITLAITACTAISADWVKAGATREDMRADSAFCRGEVEAVVGRQADVSHDIRSSSTAMNSDITQLREQTRDAGLKRDYDKMFDRCMRSRGYTR